LPLDHVGHLVVTQPSRDNHVDAALENAGRGLLVGLEVAWNVGAQIASVDDIVKFASVRELQCAGVARGLNMQDLERAQESGAKFAGVGQVDVFAVEKDLVAGLVVCRRAPLVEVLGLS